MAIIPLVIDVDRVRGGFVTVVPGAEVRIVPRGDLVTDPAVTHYADELGTGPSTANLIVNSSGQIVTYIDTASVDFFFRVGTGAWSGPIPQEAVAGGGITAADIEQYSYATYGANFTSATEWQVEFGFLVGGKHYALINGFTTIPGTMSVSSAALYPQTARDVVILGSETGTPQAYNATVATNGTITVTGTPDFVNYSISYIVED